MWGAFQCLTLAKYLASSLCSRTGLWSEWLWTIVSTCAINRDFGLPVKPLYSSNVLNKGEFRPN